VRQGVAPGGRGPGHQRARRGLPRHTRRPNYAPRPAPAPHIGSAARLAAAGTPKSVLTRLVARGSARSYHLDPDEKKKGGRPSINYARGDEIVITMKTDGSEKVDLVEVRGKVDGVQLSPSAEKPGEKPGGEPAENPAGRAPGAG